MAKGGHNSKGSDIQNYSTLSTYVVGCYIKGNMDIQSIGEGEIKISIKDNLGETHSINIVDGSWYDTTSGVGKANQRSYIGFPIPGNDKFMCADYVMMMALTFISGNETAMNMGKLWRNTLYLGEMPCINHINGDTFNNCYDNLEVTTTKLNRAHGRLMYELYMAWPNKYVTIRGYDGDRPMFQYTSDNRVTCEQIERFNSGHIHMFVMDAKRRFKILGHNDVNGTYKPSLTDHQLHIVACEFGLR